MQRNIVGHTASDFTKIYFLGICTVVIFWRKKVQFLILNTAKSTLIAIESSLSPSNGNIKYKNKPK